MSGPQYNGKWDYVTNRIPKPKSCFGCCSLEKGSKIIGWFHLIIFSLLELGCFVKIVSDITLSKEKQARRYVPLLIFGIISIYIGTMFLIGVYKMYARYIKWYIAYIAAITCFALIAMIVFTVTFAVSDVFGYGCYLIILSLLTVLIVFSTNFFIVVFSYYRENKGALYESEEFKGIY